TVERPRLLLLPLLGLGRDDELVAIELRRHLRGAAAHLDFLLAAIQLVGGRLRALASLALDRELGCRLLDGHRTAAATTAATATATAAGCCRRIRLGSPRAGEIRLLRVACHGQRDDENRRQSQCPPHWCLLLRLLEA